MNKIFTGFLALLLLLNSCTTETQKHQQTAGYPEKAAAYTIYEVNIRQHTPEGTFNAFAKDLPRLKDLGIDMLWIMPIHPIGVLNRKEPLGSYYSVKNYKEVNPAFGTDEDFANLVKSAHALGMDIILDWVPNHSAYDNPWITEHPDFYVKDKDGNIAHEADWTDIALLDHTNPGTRRAMIDAMKYWVEEFDIDGFRCDHAGHEIPLYFWEEARKEIDPIKDILWLAEWDGARMHLQFDLTYAWELLHLSSDVAHGKGNADAIAQWIEKDRKEYGNQPFRMTMITNHDENSWHGTLREKFGDAHQTFATFIFTAYGIPMMYSGQEVGLDKRLKFFEKDSIDWSDPQQLQPFYKKLNELKKNNQALWAGEFGGAPERINADSSIFAFRRSKGTSSVIGIMNFSDKPQTLIITDPGSAGTYNDYFTGKSYLLSKDKPLELAPWQYLIFVVS